MSNAPVWATARLLPASVRGTAGSCLDATAPKTPSFLHLHCGFDASGLDPLAVHHIIVRDWSDVTSNDNLVFISIPSVLDDAAAPAGHHVLHAYLPPRRSPTRTGSDWTERHTRRRRRHFSRSCVLWRAVEEFIPDIRERAVYSSIGTPLTHERFLRRPEGTYGSAWKAGEKTFPGHASPVDGPLLLRRLDVSRHRRPCRVRVRDGRRARDRSRRRHIFACWTRCAGRGRWPVLRVFFNKQRTAAPRAHRRLRPFRAGRRARDLVLDAALVLAAHDAEEALLAPVGVPRVGDLPVFGAVLHAPTDDLDGVTAGGLPVVRW